MTENEEDAEGEPWLRIDEPPVGDITTAQEAAIRDYAFGEGYETLRGYHMHLRSMGWDYYNILHIVSP